MEAPREGSDLIEVRPDERFDERRLAEWLRGRLEGAELPLRVRQFGGGHANLTYLLEFGAPPEGREYVLRRPPLGPVATSAHDMHREYRALSRLWRGFPLAPRAFLYCAERDVIGADFLVFKADWDAQNPNDAPELMGQLLHLFESPNRFRLPDFYTLHVWAWKNNPTGTFVNWHSNVSCDSFNGQVP